VSPEQFTLVESVFARGLESDADQRDEVVREACRGDVVVLERVRELLDAHFGAGHFLETPSSARLDTALSQGDADDPYLGRRFGAYEATERIGVGGMGVVYRGRRSDEQYEKRVAIKFVRQSLNSADIHERFERERRLLAPLQHPNIAMLLDAGVAEDGTPYIVMEHVEGRQIDEHCRLGSLGVEDRLRLFLSVCDAVQSAHSALVAHLDLKPSNILVTPDGHVKLVDFGVAQLLNSRDTPGASRAFTPAYAAPEQIEGTALSASTDVYALGAVLYNLLANVRPFATESEAGQNIEETMLSKPPTPPSGAACSTGGAPNARATARLRRRLAGDLDMIVLKAMRKEPAERYRSPSALADDIRRHLNGRTIYAAPDTLAYRSSRFLRRNRYAVGAVVLLTLTLAGGVMGTAWQAAAATRERSLAETRFEDLRRLTNILITQVDERLADLPGSIEARRAIIVESTSYLESLSRDVQDEPDLLLEVAASYEQLADLQRNMISSDLGDTERAMQNHLAARDLRERVLALRPNDPDALKGLATSAIRVGDMRRSQGDLDGAISAYHEGNDRWEHAGLTGVIDELNALHSRAVALTKIGIVEQMRGNLDECEAAYTEAHAMNREIVERDPTRLVDLRNLAVTLEKLGDVRERTGDAHAALVKYREAHTIYTRLSDTEPNDSRHLFSVAVSHSKLGEVLGYPTYTNLGDVPGAVREYELGRGVIARLVRADPSDARASGAAAFFDRRLGTLYALNKQFDQALALQIAAHDAALTTVAQNPSDTRALTDVASTRMTIAATHEEMGDLTNAIAWRERAIDAQKHALEINPDSAGTRLELAVALRSCADNRMALAQGAQPDSASVRASLELAREEIAEGASHLARLREFGDSHAALAEELIRSGESATLCETTIAALPSPRS